MCLHACNGVHKTEVISSVNRLCLQAEYKGGFLSPWLLVSAAVREKNEK
jgi:hypothetical protein